AEFAATHAAERPFAPATLRRKAFQIQEGVPAVGASSSSSRGRPSRTPAARRNSVQCLRAPPSGFGAQSGSDARRSSAARAQSGECGAASARYVESLLPSVVHPSEKRAVLAGRQPLLVSTCRSTSRRIFSDL